MPSRQASSVSFIARRPLENSASVLRFICPRQNFGCNKVPHLAHDEITCHFGDGLPVETAFMQQVQIEHQTRIQSNSDLRVSHALRIMMLVSNAGSPLLPYGDSRADAD